MSGKFMPAGRFGIGCIWEMEEGSCCSDYSDFGYCWVGECYYGDFFYFLRKFGLLRISAEDEMAGTALTQDMEGLLIFTMMKMNHISMEPR
ncbi:hypothetical protein CRYUN_Cryun04dG0101000 [Craigia yunnanensis]